MINEEIVGGLVSALSRGESLEKAMMSFYNAGYKKDEIEDSAKTVYAQLGAQAMGVKGSLQDTFKAVASKVVLTKKNPSQETLEEDTSEKPMQEKMSYNEDVNKNKNTNINTNTNNKPQQKVSNYNDSNYQKNNYPRNNYDGAYHNVDQVTDKIVRAIKDLKQVNFPSRIEIVSKNEGSRPDSTVIQKVSDYSSVPPKPVSKAATYVLVFLLILLLGILAAVFFFKDELINMFNNIGLS